MPTSPDVKIFTALTAAGSTTPIFSSEATYIFLVASIGTNVIVVIEESLDGTNWAEVGAQTTITANGSFSLHYNVGGRVQAKSRFTLVSISGGTPSVTVKGVPATVGI